MKPLAPLAICARCPRPATKTCSQCKMMSYCSEAHQREDWKDVHKIECPALKYTATRKMSREVRQDLANTRRCIGEMYRDGLGTARNKKLAADYLAKSRLLAESRHTSEGIALNNENKYYAAMKHLQRGVDEDGCSEAMFYIASLHFYGRGTAVDRHEAFKWYLRAAEKGHVMAMNNVAGCYMRGEGGEQSMEKSRYWL